MIDRSNGSAKSLDVIKDFILNGCFNIIYFISGVHLN